MKPAPHRATIAMIPCPSCAYQDRPNKNDRFVIEMDSKIIWPCGTEAEAKAKLESLSK